MKLAIAATFTAEPLQDSLAFWADKLQWPVEVAFASYNQVFQQLLDPASLLSTNKSGFNIVLVRPEDWRKEEVETPHLAKRGSVSDAAGEFLRAIISAQQRSTTPYLLCLCPASPEKAADAHILQAEELISEGLERYPGVHILRGADLDSMYPVREYYDPNRDELASIPYTSEFFAALGTTLIRRMHSLRRPPYKVIVSDCDETLWKGVCAEVGPKGVDIDNGHRALQEFLLKKQSQGMLLCLCSKNLESDVDEVFRCQPMALKAEHIIARCVNWRPKPENLRELAAELQLGLDTFIFIDDNPLECEQMRSAFPQVLTLQLPSSENIPEFLRNVWSFDEHRVTEEDRSRTALYRENRERDRFRQQAPTLEGFLAGLQLEINIAPTTPEQIPRIAQLTQRTNQFNFTSLRRNEGEVARLLQSTEWDCLTVHVKDRFGDYGIVGVMMFRSIGQLLKVDTFLLSCRVLGRGIEHAMLRHLGNIALSRGLSRVELEFVPTKRNTPALAFLESVASDSKQPVQSGFVFCVPARYAAEISQSKVLATIEAAADAVTNADSKDSNEPVLPAASELIQEIATELHDLPSIVKAIRSYKGFSEERLIAVEEQPPNSFVQIVAQAWSEVLSHSEIHARDDFFALGGDSLLATQVISRLRQACGVRLHLSDLFDNPTVEGLARIILEKKGDNAKARAEEPASVVKTISAIPRRTGHGPCALSFSQQRWWFLNQWAPGTADHLSLVLRLKGALDRNALELSLRRLIERHDILRTSYKLVEDNPVQSVSSTNQLPFSFVSFVDIPAPQRESEGKKLVDRQFRQPFDLGNDPPLRATLLQYAPEDHVLVLVMHHIASDGWSRGILLRELEIAYKAYVCGQDPPFSDLPVQYSDFCLWQREHFAELEDQISYWKQRLAGAPALLQLPTDYPRPALPTLREGVHTRVLPQSSLSQLQALGQSQGATLFMSLLAAFQALLYRYSGQQDIVVGSPVAGRNHPDVDGVIGCFINMVAFRSQVDCNTTFREFLAQVRKVALEAEERQEVPFEKLVEELERGRDTSRAPIFQAVLALENLLSTPHFPGIDVELQEVETRSALHDISLFAAQQADGLRLRFEYRTDLFTNSTIERLADHFTRLLSAIVSNPDQTIDCLPILAEDERFQLLHRWNENREYPVESCVHQLFEKQAARVPERTALVFEEQTLNYGELNARSNQLAHYLRRAGVGPDVLVGLCMQRSLDLVIAILAILKAGGAYLPLDPSYATERLGFMIEDAQPPVVITQYDLKDNLPGINAQVVALDAEWPEIERESSGNLDCPAQPQNLAYVIYTSGSTGRPKGCQITHANLVRLFAATDEWFRFDEHDIWTMFHSYAFDFSVWELWGALFYGGKLVIVPQLVSRSPEDFYQLLQDEAVTVLNQTPSSFRQLIHMQEGTKAVSPLALRYVIFGGEALDMQSLEPWFARHGDQKPRLINMYGITETTVHVTYRPLSMQDTTGGSVIGRPIPDLQLYLLDRNCEPVPIGVAGEMYVGGPGVARGYLNRPELNQERFIPDVFRPGENRRLYKSGDQARRLANGDIEYLGRIDQQVKIRGFRIELGEIESVLAQHPNIREAVVQLDSDADGERRLIAYVVPQTDQIPPRGELYAFLKERLPEYMVPAAFVNMERMPLTANGKIDRQALPAADLSRFDATPEFTEARTPLEREVANSWREVLGLQRIGINDNFFEIGGHSLLATRVIILLRAKLGLNFSLRLLFENPTVAGMAGALIEPLLEHVDQQEASGIIDEVEALSREAARAQKNKQEAAANDVQRTVLSSARA